MCASPEVLVLHSQFEELFDSANFHYRVLEYVEITSLGCAEEVKQEKRANDCDYVYMH